MAASTQKKTTTKKKGKSAASGKSASSRKTAQKRPVRREVAGVVLLVLALCTVVSYFKVSAILLDWLAALLLLGRLNFLMLLLAHSAAAALLN